MRDKKVITFFLKAIVTVAAFWYVVSNVPFLTLWALVKSAQPFWVLLAFGWFVLSKLASAYRLQRFFSSAGIFLTPSENIKLYWLGMFYNQFLPGGIGGDAYKAYWLGKERGYSKIGAAKTILWDRVSGLMALTVLLLLSLGAFFMSYSGVFLALLLGGASYVLYFNFSLYLKFIQEVDAKAEMLSWVVQLCQFASAFCLIKALHIEGVVLPYLIAFLFSSLVSVLPITVGGMGARELAFVFASGWLGLHKEMAVSLGFLFYLISLIASLWGLVYAFSFSKSLKTRHSST
jgi:uncharacterized membrane protein YbhN (UPF0104 family)